MPNSSETTQAPRLDVRRLGLLNATSINMSNMVGTGPFITLPLIVGAMGGPQALLGWFAGAAIAIADGMVWSELAAALPGSGGSYVYLRESFNRNTWGRLWAFLFVFQLVSSGPLEIASGNIAVAQYLGYLFPLTPGQSKLIAVGVGILATALLYRKITSIARLMMALWTGMLVTVGWLILSGLWRFSAGVALEFPTGAFDFNRSFVLGLTSATLYVMYCYLGYYGVCYLGDEVKEPARTIPRAVVISIVAVLLINFLISFSILGVIPWREVMNSQFVASELMRRIYGHWAGIVMTLLIVWTAFASVYALILTYSRVPFAAAQDGSFFRIFSKVHPIKDFPHYSLLLIGGLSALASCFDLQDVISSLMTARILVQFLGQIVALHFLRRFHSEIPRPFRMWLYPFPSLLAFAGWMAILLNSGGRYIAYGMATVVLGICAYFWMAKSTGYWPFAARKMLTILIAISLLSLAGCGIGRSPGGSSGPDITSTVVPDGEIWFRHSRIQLRFDSEMYCRVFLQKEGKLLSINDIPPVPEKAKPPQFIFVNDKEIKNFQIDYANVGVSELRTQFGEGKRLNLTGYAKTSQGTVIEKKLKVEMYQEFPDVAIVSASYRNIDKTVCLRISHAVNNFFRMDAARSDADKPSYDFWLVQGGTEQAGSPKTVRVSQNFCARIRFPASPSTSGHRLIDLWTESMGMAVADISVEQMPMISTVWVATDQKVILEMQSPAASYLAPGQSYESSRSAWMVHTGDSAAVVHRVRQLRERITGNPAQS